MSTLKIVVVSMLIGLAGCASMVIKEEDIVKKTEFALSLDKSNFTISDRADQGVQTTYKVTTKSGKRYNCNVDGSFSFGTGKIVSDAVCSEIGKPAKSTSDASCNALQKATGKC
jgi:hypothetical protein